MCLFSAMTEVHFHGGCIYSWIAGKRHIPALSSITRCAQGCIVVFSYGEIDCRCHANKFSREVHGLAEPYARAVRTYVESYTAFLHKSQQEAQVVPIVLAVPPATDQGYNPLAPSKGTLATRVQATELLNTALAEACAKEGVAFTGVDTWDFAKSENGSLRPELSDGHVHIESALCGPVHQRIRQLLTERLPVQFEETRRSA